MKAIKNILKWIIYMPILIIAFYLASLGLERFASYVYDLNTFWFIVALLVFGSAVLAVAKAFGSVISMVFMIAPNIKIGVKIFITVALIMGISSLIGCWVVQDAGWFRKLIMECVVIVFWSSVLFIPSNIEETGNDNHRNTIPTKTAPCNAISGIAVGDTIIFHEKQHNVLAVHNGFAELEEVMEDGLGKSFDVPVEDIHRHMKVKEINC